MVDECLLDLLTLNTTIMRRIKVAFISTAIVLGLGSAYAGRPCDACTYADQYIYSGGTYVPAGTFGYDYYCLDFGGVCTFYKPNPITQPNTYAPCRFGVYTIIP